MADDQPASVHVSSGAADAATLPPASPPDRTAALAGPPVGVATLPPATAPYTPAPPPERVQVPGYEIIEELGRGGMGVVYKACQVGLNRLVALKMILAGGHASLSDLDRFRTEAEAVARLQHPNIVQIHEIGDHDGLPYFSLEFCPGGSLDQKLAGTPQPPDQAAALAETLARAVQAAHAKGIVHRDLKPANVLLADDGTPKITDFGIAKRLDSAAGRTATGAILGTPSYMAPEQAGGDAKAVGPAADVYALGAILYELLTGRPPFLAATPLDTLLQVVSDDPVPPTRLNPQTPRDLETIALKCLAKEPAKRYPSAAALADDLRRFRAGEPIAARPAGRIEKTVKWAKRRPAVAMLSAAVVLAVAGGFAGVLYELGVAKEARAKAETQEGLANQRAGELARQAEELSRQQARVRRELHQSNLLRADLLLQGKEFAQAEQLLWRTHLTRPDEDDDDRRAFWRLWELYHQRPRRAGWRIELPSRRFWSPDGRRVAVVREPRVTIHDAATGAVQTEFRTSQTRVYVAAFSRDGNRLGLVSSDDGSVTVWDLEPAPTLRTTLRPTAPPRPELMLALGAAYAGLPQDQVRQAQQQMFFSQTSLCFLGDDRVLITNPDSATLWNLRGPAPAALTRLKLESVTGLGASLPGVVTMPTSPAADTILVLRAGAVQLWDLPRTPGGSITRTRLDFTDPAGFRRAPVAGGRDRDQSISAVVLSPDGKWLITHSNGRLRVWDVASGAKRGEVQGTEPAEVLDHLAVTPDGTAVRSINRDGIRLWRLPGLEPVRTIPLLSQAGLGRHAALSPDGRQTYIDEGPTIAVYDHQPAETVRPLRPPDPGNNGPTLRTDLAATGPVIGLKLDGIVVWGDGRADRITLPQGMFQMPERQLAIAPTGTTAVSYRYGLFGTTVTTYDLVARKTAGKPIDLRHPERGTVRLPVKLAIAPDGRTLVAQTEHGLLVADLSVCKVVRALGNTELLSWNNTVFTPDSRAVLFVDPRARELVLLNLADGGVLVRAAYPGLELPVVFSPNGALVATTAERKLILRDGSTLKEIGEISASVNDLGTGAFAPDGRTIVTGGRDGKLRLWDVPRREELVTLDLGAGPIHKLVFTPDGAKVRFIAAKQVGELDLHAYDPYVAGNRTWNLLRLLPELDRAEAERVLSRLRDSHPEAYRAGIAALGTAEAAKSGGK
jgi:WD40 repeat protein